MKTCIVIGAGSEIYNKVKPMFEADGWTFYAHDQQSYYPSPSFPKWDLCLMPMGRVAPVGNWWDLGDKEVEACFEANLIKPFRWLRRLWHWRAPDATVIWFSGSNPQKIMDGYAPYNTAKMAVNKLIEQLDHETPDCKFVAFGPGYVAASPIHGATKEKNWPNERIARGDAGTPLEAIYATLAWCIRADKSVVGGRNIAVSDMANPDLDDILSTKPDFGKLRRVQ